jgi:hypothetical protein
MIYCMGIGVLRPFEVGGKRDTNSSRGVLWGLGPYTTQAWVEVSKLEILQVPFGDFNYVRQLRILQDIIRGTSKPPQHLNAAEFQSRPKTSY